MHDLTLYGPGGVSAAVEVTNATDAASTELWGLVNGPGRWIEPGLTGGWGVALYPTARANEVMRELPGLLRELEQRAEPTTVRHWPGSPVDIETRMEALGVASLHQGATDFPGSIHLTIALPADQAGGAVPDTGDPLASWLSSWMLETDCADNLRKLADSGLEQRHLFVIVRAFSSAPFPVTDLVMRDGAPAPTIDPDLPEAITHVWVTSVWSSGVGFRWEPELGWLSFSKLQPSRAPRVN